MLSNLGKMVISLVLLDIASVDSLRKSEIYPLSTSPLKGFYGKQNNYTTEYFTVPIDHFNSSLKGTFEMRYLSSNTWQQKENPPIFFYAGSDAHVEEFIGSAAFMYEIAPTFGALIIFAEHRYYGHSRPFGGKSFANKENRKYLTSQQVIHDYINLLKFLKSNPAMKNSPVIAFGGFYGGMLSAWMRMKYPDIVHGAIASSAPLLQFDGIRDCSDYYRSVTSTFRAADPRCSEVIRRSWGAIDNVTSTADGRKWLSAKWDICKVIANKGEVLRLKYIFQNAYSILAMQNYPYAYSLPANPVNEFCKILTNPEGSDREILQSLKIAIDVIQPDNNNCINLIDTNFDFVTWAYQQCTDLPMNTCSDGIHDMFEPKPWNRKEWTKACQAKFHVKPQFDLACKIYGCSDFRGASNIVFSNGLLDPWHVGGILKNISDSVIAVIIPDGAHQLDLLASNPEDPESVVKARKAHEESIGKWIQEYRESQAVQMKSKLTSFSSN